MVCRAVQVASLSAWVTRGCDALCALVKVTVWLAGVYRCYVHHFVRGRIHAWVYGLSAVVGQPSVLPPLSDDLQLCPWTGRRDWSAFCPFAFR